MTDEDSTELMYVELMKGDSLEGSADTPKYNPHSLPLKSLRRSKQLYVTKSIKVFGFQWK